MDQTDFTDIQPGTSSTDPLYQELDQPRFKSASEPASTPPIACLQRRPLLAHSLVERHSTAPIAAVLPEDKSGSSPDGSATAHAPYAPGTCAATHVTGHNRRRKLRQVAYSGTKLLYQPEPKPVVYIIPVKNIGGHCRDG
jgi:hypothetical protein